MSFSKAQLKGTKQVFSFTFLSLLKNKANIIAVAVFLIAGLLAVPAAMLLGGRQISSRSRNAGSTGCRSIMKQICRLTAAGSHRAIRILPQRDLK